MEGNFRTDTGRIRTHNEDSGAVIKSEKAQTLTLVADGMGGHQAGDVASKMACDGLVKYWQESVQNFNPKEAEKWLLDTVTKLNEDIYQYATKNPQCEGMGTTLVAAICADEFVSFCNVGDSRMYLFESEQLKQMTYDHSLVQELVRSGQLSEDEAEHHPRKNVLLRSLGTESEIDVDIATVGWKEGDILLLCSDGLTNKVTDEEISSQLSRPQPLEEISKELVQMANEYGGEDNITITLVRHETKDVKDE